MNEARSFSADVLRLDVAVEIDRIVTAIRDSVRKELKRKGAVVGLSGGVDSSVTASLCARALGKDRILALLMPEKESSADSLRLGQEHARLLGIHAIVEETTPLLHAVGCYDKRDEMIRSVVPDYGPGFRCKIVLPSLSEAGAYRVFSVVVRSPDGKETKARLPLEAYQGIVAATNYKQRTRKILEYYHADRLNYAVVGTHNRLEYDQGFFVKNGDGAADLEPIAHLYKTQVYQLAEALGVPREIRERVPTTDTYSMEQTQEEFYFSVPYDKMDLCMYGRDHGVPPADVARCAGLTTEQVERVYGDITAKRKAARYLHLPALLTSPITRDL